MQKIKPIVLRTKQHTERAIEIIRMLPNDPVMVVSISKHKDSKSLAQLRTVHMWIKEVQDFYQESQGKFYTLTALKFFFKDLFGVIDVVETPQGTKEVMKSFSEYSCEEMQNFMENMNHYCGSELRVFLTIPGLDDQHQGGQ